MNLNDSVKQKIKEIFENVNYWLAFGEAKNAGLLVFNAGILGVLIQVESKGIFVYSLCVLMLFSLVVILWGLFSRMSLNRSKDSIEEKDNLLFYMDISKYERESYAKAIYKRYFNKPIANLNEVPMDIQDMIDEIIINARITTKKYKVFNFAVKIDFFTIILVISYIVFIA